MSEKSLVNHLKVSRYGQFQLTEAVRPSPDLQVIPREAYRINTYRDASAGLAIPLLAASVSGERVFELFLALLEPLGPTVNVVLETSHNEPDGRHRDLSRDEIDLPILQSYLCEFEDLLLNDGCTGVAVVGTGAPMEVQFDEHKLLIVYARDLEPFERLLLQNGVDRDDGLRLITEGEHLHLTDPGYAEAFDRLCCQLGVAEAAEHARW